MKKVSVELIDPVLYSVDFFIYIFRVKLYSVFPKELIPHSHQLNMFNKLGLTKENQSKKSVGWLLQKTLVSFNLYALISTKFEIDKNHCTQFDVKTT